MYPVTILENMLHPCDYHNPEDVKKIRELEFKLETAKELIAKIEQYTKNENKSKVIKGLEESQARNECPAKRSRSNHKRKTQEER